MSSEAEKEGLLVFRTLRFIECLDKSDEHYDFQVASLADEVSHILSYDQLMSERQRLCMNHY